MQTLLQTPDIAEMMGVKEQTVIKWRHKKVGPPWFKLEGGGIRYDKTDVLIYIETQKGNNGGGQSDG